MTLRKLASQLCKLEGKKSQIKMGDMMETLKLLTTYIASEFILTMQKNPENKCEEVGSPAWRLINNEIDKKIDKFYKKQTKQKRKK